MAAKLSDHVELNLSDNVVLAPVLYDGQARDRNIVDVPSIQLWTGSYQLVIGTNTSQRDRDGWRRNAPQLVHDTASTHSINVPLFQTELLPLYLLELHASRVLSLAKATAATYGAHVESSLLT